MGWHWRFAAAALRVARVGALSIIITIAACLATTVGRAADAPAPQPTDGQTAVDRIMEAFPQGLTPEQLDAILGSMDDQTMRAALHDRLLMDMEKRQNAKAAPPAQNFLEIYQRRLDAVAAAYPIIGKALTLAFAHPGGADQPIDPLRLCLSIAILLAAGIGASLLTRRFFAATWLASMGKPAVGTSALQQVSGYALQIIAAVLEVGAFCASVMIAFALLRPTHHALATAILFLILQAALIVLVSEMVLRFLCDPQPGRKRIAPLSDNAARAIYRSVLGAVLLIVALSATARILQHLGMARDALAAVFLPLSIAPFALLAMAILRHRHGINAVIAGTAGLATIAGLLRRQWHFLVAAYLLILWLVVAGGILTAQSGITIRVLASLGLTLAVPMSAWLTQRALEHAYGIGPDKMKERAAKLLRITGERDDVHISTEPSAQDGTDTMPENPAHAYLNRLMLVIWAVLIVLAIIVTARIWGFDFSRTTGFTGLVAHFAFSVGIVVLMGYIAWILIVRAIDRSLERARQEGSQRAHRLSTLLPLLRKLLKLTLITVIIMVGLSSMGIEIGPLLAGAGVVGIAIGFGAQQTIADIFAGVFFLLEDAFHIGDYVEVGNLRGDVEGISLRSLKLRHQRGAVHILPFGQMKSLTNYTRDWSLMRLEFRLAPDTDPELVKQLVKKIGKDLLADPDLGPHFIETLKSQGIRNVEDGALVFGVKYITKPGEQFIVRREAYQRIIKAFKENGIELVGRGVVVKIEHGEDAEIAAAAAAGSMAGGQKDPG